MDAIVIGGGPNGLVAANLLVDAGWGVTLFEANAEVGGAVRSAEDVAESFVHDTFSAFYPLAAASPAIRGLGLEPFGLRWSHAPAPVGNPMPDGGWALIHPSPEATAAAFDERAPGDGDAWLALYERWTAVSPDLLGALLTPFPPVRHGARLAARLAGQGRDGLEVVRLLAASARWLGESRFVGDAPSMLLATNALHADLAPDGAGSGLMGWLLVMIAQQLGCPVPQGGAGMLSAALARRFTAAGGTIACDTRITEVLVRSGRAHGVRSEHGDVVEARRAVLADVAATDLYGGLVDWTELPGRVRTAMSRFRWDPATVKVDWALDGPVPWTATPARAPGAVHIADSVDELGVTAAQVAGGAIPDRPFLLMGQMTTADPSRSPAGTESVWAYTHVPQRVRTDAGDGSVRGVWDTADGERMADRMQARVERYAPGFGSRVKSRRVLTPQELQRRDANLVGGAVNGGTAALHQQLVFRPTPGLGRAETPVRGLYLASASAHPGGGVHGACGANAARAALFHARIRR